MWERKGSGAKAGNRNKNGGEEAEKHIFGGKREGAVS